MKRFNFCVAAVALSILVGEAAFAAQTAKSVSWKSLDPGDSILDDVYVKLYVARLRRAKLSIERQKQDLDNAVRNRSRLEEVYKASAGSLEELERSRRDVEVAALRVQEAEASAQEAETFVDIAVSRVSIGLPMPICAEIR